MSARSARTAHAAVRAVRAVRVHELPEPRVRLLAVADDRLLLPAHDDLRVRGGAERVQRLPGNRPGRPARRVRHRCWLAGGRRKGPAPASGRLKGTWGTRRMCRSDSDATAD